MGKEIEHKFLIHPEKLPRLSDGKKLQQGYLCANPIVRVRTRIKGRRKQAFLTIKGKGKRVRAEYEYEIPYSDAKKLMKLCGKLVLRKIRYDIGRWEVDQFLGRHKGLWLAEIELKSTVQRLPRRPKWVGREVTSDARFANANLVAKSYKQLKRML
jgi:adenylate cyclase